MIDPKIAESVKNLEPGDVIKASFGTRNGYVVTVEGPVYIASNYSVHSGPAGLRLGRYIVRWPLGSAGDDLTAPVITIKKKMSIEPPVGSIRFLDGRPMMHAVGGWVVAHSSRTPPFYTWKELVDTSRPISEEAEAPTADDKSVEEYLASVVTYIKELSNGGWALGDVLTVDVPRIVSALRAVMDEIHANDSDFVAKDLLKIVIKAPLGLLQ